MITIEQLNFTNKTSINLGEAYRTFGKPRILIAVVVSYKVSLWARKPPFEQSKKS